MRVRRIIIGMLFALCAFIAAACTDDEAALSPVPPDPIVLTRGPSENPQVALLFEVNAGTTAPGAVGEILATLRERRLRASFALTGRWAEANVALTRAIAADGHLIVNGGYDGTSFTGQSTGLRSLTPEQRSLELTRTETSVYRITNRTTQPFFRPPLGDTDASVERDAASAGYPVLVAGSMDARTLVDAPALLARIETAASGEIIVLSTASSAPAATALGQVIDQLATARLAVISIEAFVTAR